MHLSTTVTHGSWIVGGELGNGTADGRLGARPRRARRYRSTVGLCGEHQPAAQCRLGTAHYNRNTGTFYNGAPRIEMDAGFLHLQFKV